MTKDTAKADKSKDRQQKVRDRKKAGLQMVRLVVPIEDVERIEEYAAKLCEAKDAREAEGAKD